MSVCLLCACMCVRVSVFVYCSCALWDVDNPIDPEGESEYPLLPLEWSRTLRLFIIENIVTIEKI